MRFLRILAFAVAAPLLVGTTLGQTPPSTPLFGTMAHTFARSASSNAWCANDLGTSLFQRTGSGTARIAFPEVSYSVPQTLPNTAAPVPLHYFLSGRAQLIFSTASSGKIYFNYATGSPTTISQPPFVSYQQSFNSANGTLTVSFVIKFPTCNLVVAATYRT